MLRLALFFLIVALIAAFFGFGLVGAYAFEAAKILFLVFIILAVIALVFGYRRGPLDV
jgi:uncharacterized membrane protein YtjA (UPF0391 family)